MEEATKPTSTPRKRRSFGMSDLRRLHRRSGERLSLKKWARSNKRQIHANDKMTDKVQGLLW